MTNINILDIPVVLLMAYTIYAILKQNRILKDIANTEKMRSETWKIQANDWRGELTDYKEKIVDLYKKEYDDLEKIFLKLKNADKTKDSKIQQLEEILNNYKNEIEKFENGFDRSNIIFKKYSLKLESYFEEAKILEEN